MKKVLVLTCALFMTFAAANATELNVPQPQKGKPEFAQKMQKHIAAFDEKLGLTDVQKQKAKEIRIKGHKKIKPIFEEIQGKKKEIEMIKLSKMAEKGQAEKIEQLNKEIQALEKQLKKARKENMKEFESILTKEQKATLKTMKKEGRKRYYATHPKCKNKK